MRTFTLLGIELWLTEVWAVILLKWSCLELRMSIDIFGVW